LTFEQSDRSCRVFITRTKGSQRFQTASRIGRDCAQKMRELRSARRIEATVRST
jgi:hypothetical protein